MQPRPEGLAQAFIIGKDFIGQDVVCLILGDNIFYGYNLSKTLTQACGLLKGGVIFGYPVKDPQRYGVVQFNNQGKVVGIEEKPPQPRSNYAVPGIYFYSSEVVAIAENLVPSARGELEITDVNMAYLRRGELEVRLLSRGIAWLDTGTPDALQQAASYVQTIQQRQGLKVACIEEIAFRLGYISTQSLRRLAEAMASNEYSGYLLELAAEPEH